jgi:pyridoxamine 5'-phosphate oxidase
MRNALCMRLHCNWLIRSMNIFRNKSLRQLVANFRNEYLSHGIDEHSLAANPIEQFDAWFQDAVKSKIPEPNALHLATATIEGKPSGRVMLLKGYDEKGFVFFTNYNSRKGRELSDNQYAAITFLWLELFRSVRIEGTVSKVSAEESDAYFQSRPRTSQLGAWVSEQSKHLHNRKELDARYKEIEKLFEGKPIARPAHWGGFCLKPNHIEFWQGRASRLHDRVVYTLYENGAWNRERLYP